MELVLYINSVAVQSWPVTMPQRDEKLSDCQNYERRELHVKRLSLDIQEHYGYFVGRTYTWSIHLQVKSVPTVPAEGVMAYLPQRWPLLQTHKPTATC